MNAQYEAAYITGHNLRSGKRDANRRLFRGNALPFFLKALSSKEGYIYASHKRGGRFMDIRLSPAPACCAHAIFGVSSDREARSFDYEKSTLREMYKRVNELPDTTLEQVRDQFVAFLAAYPVLQLQDKGIL